METISKKELLELTGISYGQLYRWKREKLIPEEWFMKQSSFTGQETFFPKEQMISRVRSILELKDSHSLEELSKILEPDVSACMYREDLDLVEEIDRKALDRILLLAKQETFRLTDVAFFIMVSRAKDKYAWEEEAYEALLAGILPRVFEREAGDFVCTFFITDGKYHMALSKEGSRIMFDTGVSVTETVMTEQIVSSMKISYNHLFH